MDTDRIKAALEGLVKEAIVLGDDYFSLFDDCKDSDTIQGWDKARWVRLRAAHKEAKEVLSLLSAPSPVGQEASAVAVEIMSGLVFDGNSATFDPEAFITERIQSALDAAVAGERERCMERACAYLGKYDKGLCAAIKEAKR